MGLPIGFRYHASTYADSVWDTYWYEKNLHGDIVGIYNAGGTLLISYVYNAYGRATTSYHNGGAATTATKNPFKYRGYYFDSDLNLYYLQTRYYDPYVGRFISPDDVSYLGANGDLLSYNLYAYCSNNPVMYVDPTGEFIISLSTVLIGMAIGAAIGGGISLGVTMYEDYSDDGSIFNGSVSFREYFGNITGGLISGAGIGLCTTLGAGIGAKTTLIKATAKIVFNFSAKSAVSLGLGAAYATGLAGYSARVAISDGETFQLTDMFIEGGVNAFSGALSLGAGFVGGVTGVKVAGAKNGIKNFLRFQLGSTYFGVYPTKVAASKIGNALKEKY